MRVHRIVTTFIPMPPKVTGQQGARLPGGLPPVAWRNAWSRAGETGKYARVHGERRTMPDKGW